MDSDGDAVHCVAAEAAHMLCISLVDVIVDMAHENAIFSVDLLFGNVALDSRGLFPADLKANTWTDHVSALIRPVLVISATGIIYLAIN